MSTPAANEALAYRPLYLQVKETLVRRLIGGDWQPGQLIPSEMELAREIGVSQGTVRKALDAMTVENLLVRRQGRGTYVAEPADARMLFRYFHLVPDAGEPVFPTSTVLERGKGAANAEEAASLGLAPRSQVRRFRRIRSFGTEPMLVETITLPAARFPGFEDLAEIPNNVYRLFSEAWGITIGRAEERLKAVAASDDDAVHLGCRPGEPLLEIVRIAFDLENTPVERRVSRCLTRAAHYHSDLR